MLNTEQLVKTLSDKMTEGTPVLDTLDTYWMGTQPAAFLSPEAKTALGNRLRTLSVNFPRLAVTALAERLTITGFRADGTDDADPALWKVWRRCHMQDAHQQAHTDALVYGRSFITVWARNGRPQISVESPRNLAVLRDPASREVTAALKRWTVEGTGYAVLYLPDRILKLTAAANVTDLYPSTGWTVTETINNPLGVVPVVPIVNKGRLSEIDGVSEMADVLDLTDALNKLMADAMVTSEFFARPRRWATGLEISEDANGNPVNPFTDEAGKLWQSEAPETKFGQFDGARLDGYGDLTATVTQQIGALTGLPPHYLGLHGDQPASADAIRSAEASLVSRAVSLQRTFGMGWGEVAKLVAAVDQGRDVDSFDFETIWANPETRTPAQAADAALKLSQIGVPLNIVLADTLGMTPAQIGRITPAITAPAEGITA
ncbi:phage portal protein [Arthrobacter sp. TMN-50]